MNANTQGSIEIVGQKSISLLPKTNTQSKYHFRWRLGIIPQWKKKTVVVGYQVNHGILDVIFEKPDDGVRFIDQDAAEKYFYGPIEVSPHVGKHVVNSSHDVNMFVLCRKCGVKHSTYAMNFIGTEDMFGSEPVSLEFNEECPVCGGERIVEINEKISHPQISQPQQKA